MANIKLCYQYRDGGNYKNNELIFANPDNVDVAELETLIISKLINKEWFYVEEWLVPDMHFGTWDNTIDVTWHEFEEVTYTDEPVNIELLLADFINAINFAKNRGF